MVAIYFSISIKKSFKSTGVTHGNSGEPTSSLLETKNQPTTKREIKTMSQQLKKPNTEDTPMRLIQNLSLYQSKERNIQISTEPKHDLLIQLCVLGY